MMEFNTLAWYLFFLIMCIIALGTLGSTER